MTEAPIDDMAHWHNQQEQDARGRATALAGRTDLDIETRSRRRQRWNNIADWHAQRAELWRDESE